MGSFLKSGPCLGTHYKAAPFKKGLQKGTPDLERTTQIVATISEAPAVQEHGKGAAPFQGDPNPKP